ncbi:hypothetical protein [Winogradskya humida]|uniref:hypothetical protein n=1 Tax=Winogradskya humida TaxID=113566 RepID=UPI0019445ECC|nr:hypothetical protein [Actinoplanes humidus]
MRRAGLIVGRVAGCFALLLGISGLAAVTAGAWIRPDLAAALGALLWSLVLIALYAAAAGARSPVRFGWLYAVWVLSALLMGQVTTGVWAAVLSARGEEVVATSAVKHVSRTGDTYTLEAGGELIPGRLTTWPEGKSEVEAVVVVRDPAGLVDPRLPEELAEAREAFWPLLLILLAVIGALTAPAYWVTRDDYREFHGPRGTRRARAAAMNARLEDIRRSRRRSAAGSDSIDH